MSYNFTLNTGFDERGNLLQLDIGDLIFSKNRVKREVKGQKWIEESVSYTKYMGEDIKPYYRERMAEDITVESLETIWGGKN